VRRASAVELSLSETLRWTEYPDAYVRRSLSRALFEARDLEQIVGGAAPTLEVEVFAFEEVRRGDRRAGRVALRYQLHDERAVLASGDVVIERAARGPEIELVVAAIGDAMAASTAELAERVARRICP
jgi:cholesterol transport system auxiliary component